MTPAEIGDEVEVDFAPQRYTVHKFWSSPLTGFRYAVISRPGHAMVSVVADRLTVVARAGVS